MVTGTVRAAALAAVVTASMAQMACRALSEQPFTARPSDAEPGFIPDPMLRGTNPRSEPDVEYDSAVKRLLDAQIALTARSEQVVLARRALAAAQGKVNTLETMLDSAKQSSRGSQSSEGVRVALKGAITVRDAAGAKAAAATLAEREWRETVIERRIAETAAARARWEKSTVPTAGAHGALVQRATVLVRFRPGMSEAEIADVLSRKRLRQVSAIPAISLVVARSLDDSQSTTDAEATRLRALVQSIEVSSAVVATASQNTLLVGDFIPRPNAAFPRKWFAADEPLVIDHHVQAWNLRQAMKPTLVGVLDEGFLGDPDIPITPAVEVKPIPPCGVSISAEHGELVAGLLGAKFDDGLGVDGAAPPANMIGCAPPAPAGCPDPQAPNEDAVLCDRRRTMSGFLNGLATLLGQVSIVNASIGYAWHDINNFDPVTSTEAKNLIAAQGDNVRMLMTANPMAVLVSSAGNDSGRPAVWSSPFNWAALGSGTQADNVIVAAATLADRTTLTPESNTDATIKAIGRNGLARVVGCPQVCTELFAEGTSGAAPMVTSTIVMMRALDNTLDPKQIKKCLGITGGAPPALDAFDAVRNCIANANEILGDLDMDGDVDEDDFVKFREMFRKVRDGIVSVRDAQFVREDLNGDRKIDANDLQIFVEARHLSQAEAEELRRRLNQ